MVTSSIMKDMQPNLEVIYRPNAIRALARIIDVSPHTAPARTVLTNTWTLPRHLLSYPPSDSLNLPSSIGTPPYPLQRSFPHTTFTRLPKTSFADGPTKRKKPPTEKLDLPVDCTALRPTTLAAEALRSKLVTKRFRARATSCNTMLWVCFTSLGKKTGWR